MRIGLSPSPTVMVAMFLIITVVILIILFFIFKKPKYSFVISSTLIFLMVGGFGLYSIMGISSTSMQESALNQFVKIFGFNVIFFILIGFFVFYLKKKLKGGKIAKNGRPAKAKIISMGEQNGSVTTVNDQPYVVLEIEVYDGYKPPYKTKLKTFISRLQIHMFQPGATIPIKIDPNNPMKVIVDSSGTVSGVGSHETFKAKNISNKDEELINNGIDAQARIIDIKNTSKTDNSNSIVQIVCEVQVPNKSPYTLTKEVPMSLQSFELAKSFIGKTISAKVHPNDSNKVGLSFIPSNL